VPGRRRRIPMRLTAEQEKADEETADWFYRVSEDDLAAYAGKWIVQYRGEILAVGRTEDAALRRAKLPKGAAPLVYWVPPPDLILL